MKTVRNWAIVILLLGLAGGGTYEWWNLDARWRPHAFTSDQAEIGKILEASGWVSPHLPGPKLYLIGFRASPNGIAYEQSEFPKLQAAGVDTRVIVIARPDAEGAVKSTPAERATVAELWFNRSWPLYQKWLAVPADAWTAPGIPPADGDVARTAVVEVGRDAVDKLKPLLKENGVDFADPTLIWWTKDGKMMGCACTDPRTFRFVRADLGAE